MTISGLRNDQGVLRLVLCPAGHGFPDCGHDGVAQVAAIRDRGGTASFSAVAPGRYAIAVFHDENRNGKLDTFMGIPKEGYGFSLNPPVEMHAPHFAECQFDVAADVALTIRMHYLL